jgi:hypothetical protein
VGVGVAGGVGAAATADGLGVAAPRPTTGTRATLATTMTSAATSRRHRGRFYATEGSGEALPKPSARWIAGARRRLEAGYRW